jgi:two-component system, OmpR family, sensor kinase
VTSLASRLREAGRSLPVQVFAVMLATAAMVQAVNFALFFIVPPAPQRVDSVARIAVALRTGGTANGRYRVETMSGLPPGPRRQRDLDLIPRFALALGVDPVRVRVQIVGRPQDIGMAYEQTADPAAGLRGGAGLADEGDVIFGPVVVSLRQPDGRWRTVRPVAPLIEPRYLEVLGWLLAAAATVVLPAWWLARRVTRPLQTFAQAAERLGRDPHAPPVPVTGPRELAETAHAFNDMQVRLNRYVAERMTMIAAVAHDLRTPLMRMALRLPNIAGDARAALQGDIDEMDERLVAVTALVRDMSRPARRQRLDLYSLAQSVVSEAHDRDEAVTLAPGARTIVEGDPVALKSLVWNFVANACRYAGGGEVAVAADSDLCTLEVRDRGPGLPVEDADSLFDPFVRGEGSRNTGTGGMGLGLASVRAIARAHGGEAMLLPREGGGLIARVVLPAPVSAP